MADWLNFTFEWWWLFAVLPLPLLVFYGLPAQQQQAELKLALLPERLQSGSPSRQLEKALCIAIWVFVVCAIARPVWYGDPVEFQPKHRDMMLVVDLSGSMQEEDMLFEGEYVDRLSTVKHVISEFAEKRKGDRLGLILFGDHAYLQTPLTLDRQTVINQLNQTIIGLVGKSTAIGDGIGLATKVFVDSDAPQRIMILLSDGANTAGQLTPVQAAEIAAKFDTKIYTIGIGAGEMQVKQFFMTRTVNTARDLDETTLTQVAELTGGQYFRAHNAQELAQIYQTINQLEPINSAVKTWRPQTEWFGYPLGVALLLSLLLFILRRARG